MKAIEKTTIDRIVDLHSQIESALKKSLDQAIELGGLLAEVKQDLPHGQFTAWIKENLPFTDRTARNYMKVYDRRSALGEASSLADAYKALAPGKTESVSEMDEVDKALSEIAEFCWYWGKQKQQFPLCEDDWHYSLYLMDAKKRQITQGEKSAILKEMKRPDPKSDQMERSFYGRLLLKLGAFQLHILGENYLQSDVALMRKSGQFSEETISEIRDSYREWRLRQNATQFQALHTIRDYFTA